MLKLFGHPFSSYTWKAQIALYENQIPFEFCVVDGDHAENLNVLAQHSPLQKFPLLLDGDRALFESSVIIEYLQLHYPGAVEFIPANPDQALVVRTLDRFFDNYVMTSTQHIVNDFMRDPEDRDAITVETAKTVLHRCYRWLNQQLIDRRFASGESFSLADCAAAPSLFYADWVMEIDTDLTGLRDYRQRLLAIPSVRRCVEDARPFRGFFPPGAPDRD